MILSKHEILEVIHNISLQVVHYFLNKKNA